MSGTVCWAVIPAAGAGTRMGAELPKQYLDLGGRTVMEHALARLLEQRRVRAVIVALAPGDPRWPAVAARHPRRVRAVEGGAERCHSVLNALEALAGQAGDEDWVLVHDAARPCVRSEDVSRLLAELEDHPVGGLLGLPVRDTMKRADAHGDVVDTISREGLWHALTPQMFRLGPLRRALKGVIEAGGLVTDEARAMELAGHAPRMVEGHPDNIKITHPQDLPLARLYLQQRDPAP